MLLRLRIKSVDHDGYNGRDFHPDDSDIGSVVLPFKLEVFHVDPDEGDMMLLDDSNFSASFRESENLVTMFTAYTEDGRVLQLVDHEVEIAPEEGDEQ